MQVIHEFFNGAVKVLTNKVFEDERGSFRESYHAHKLKECGITDTFVQDNVSINIGRVFRGLHIQTVNTQSKLVQCLKGRIIDYFMDVREGSPTFGKIESATITDDGEMIYVPKGFAHGFSTIVSYSSNEAIVSYKCDDVYNTEGEVSINPIPYIDINWEIFSLSDKDRNGILLNDLYK